MHRFTLADADPDVRFLVHRMIEEFFPHSLITHCSNAEDALAHIRDAGTDMLITSDSMGTELIRTLRAQKGAFPIIMLSGNPQVRKAAEEAGASAFVEKSYDMSSLRHQIEELIPDY